MKADIVVIGAGAIGLSTALHAALAGRSVVVVDRFSAGSQASGRAAGLFKSVQADPARTALARRSIARAVSFGDWAGSPLQVERSGSFLVARSAAHQELLRTEAAQSRRWGADVREAAPGEMAGRVSYYQPGAADIALWCPEDIYIDDPASLIRAYLDAARRHGVEVLENEAVTGVLLSGGKVAGVQTAGRSITAPAAVDAAGAWTRQVAELAGAQVSVAPVRHQLLVTQPSAQVAGGDPIIRVLDAAVYLRPASGGLMAGGFEADPLPVDPRTRPPAFSTDDVPLDLDVLRKLTGEVAAEAPLACELPVADHRGGLFTMSPDGRFVLGAVPDVPGLWVASGCNGSGFSSSLAIGEAVAAGIDGRPPQIDLSAFGPARFGQVTEAELIERGIWQYAHYYDPDAAEQH